MSAAWSDSTNGASAWSAARTAIGAMAIRLAAINLLQRFMELLLRIDCFGSRHIGGRGLQGYYVRGVRVDVSAEDFVFLRREHEEDTAGLRPHLALDAVRVGASH